MYKLINVNYEFDNKLLLDNISLELPNKGIVLFSGKSGSGKTTLLKILAGHNKAKGTILFDDKKIQEWKNYNIASYIDQDTKLIESMTLIENICALCMIEENEETDNVLKKLNIFESRNTMSDKLSGGERQRTLIACAILKKTPVIIGDEITSALDKTNAVEILNILKELSQTRLVILSSHDVELVENYCDYKYELSDGHINSSNCNYNCEEKSIIEAPKVKLLSKKTFETSLHFYKRQKKYGICCIVVLLLLFVFSSLLIECKSWDYKKAYQTNLKNHSDELCLVMSKDDTLISDYEYNDFTIENVDFKFKDTNSIHGNSIGFVSDKTTLLNGKYPVLEDEVIISKTIAYFYYRLGNSNTNVIVDDYNSLLGISIDLQLITDKTHHENSITEWDTYTFKESSVKVVGIFDDNVDLSNEILNEYIDSKLYKTQNLIDNKNEKYSNYMQVDTYLKLHMSFTILMSKDCKNTYFTGDSLKYITNRYYISNDEYLKISDKVDAITIVDYPQSCAKTEIDFLAEYSLYIGLLFLFLFVIFFVLYVLQFMKINMKDYLVLFKNGYSKKSLIISNLIIIGIIGLVVILVNAIILCILNVCFNKLFTNICYLHINTMMLYLTKETIVSFAILWLFVVIVYTLIFIRIIFKRRKSLYA